MQKIILTVTDEAVRLEKFIAKACPAVLYAQLRRALRKKDVRVDGKRISENVTLTAGQTVTLFLPDAERAPAPLFSGERFLIVHKPQGLPVQSSREDEDSLEKRLRAAVSDAFPAACHRLDAQTAGLVLFAKDAQALEEAKELFRSHRVTKHYQAAVRGKPSPASGTLDDYLKKDAARALVRVVPRTVPGALPAKLQYETLTGSKTASVVRVRLITGRTHQIRVQFAHIGHPLLGDDRYGDREWNRACKARAQMLWACALEFDRDLPGALSELSGKRVFAAADAFHPALPDGLSFQNPESLLERR